MSELKLTPSSALGVGYFKNGNSGQHGGALTISERADLSICALLARKDTEAQLREEVQNTFGVELPYQPLYAAGEAVTFVWSGPGQWLAISNHSDGSLFEQSLRLSLGGLCSVMDHSDGRTLLQVKGLRARDALKKGILIDLDPASFKPGDTAITSVAYIGVQFWQIDAIPSYEFVIFRSFARAFCDWLLDAAAEFTVSE